MASKRGMEKQLTNARVSLTVADQQYAADCSLFIESYGPPPRWHGRVWGIAPILALKRGATATLTLPNGNTGEISVQKAGVRGAYDFRGEGLPPTF